jgi:ketosteroid isomerase-like protein
MTRWLWVAGIVGAVAAVGVQARTSAIDALVQAERAFAKTSVATSQRDAFLANFADDGVWFTPAPENVKQALLKQPAAAGPPARTLDWEPATGDVASSGDLGYTTGPYISTPRAAGQLPATGWFFSVWRRRADVGWKVAADFGIQAPGKGALRPREFQRAEVRGAAPKVRPDPKACAVDLTEADAAFAEVARRRSLQAAYRDWAAKDVLVFRQGQLPFAGRVAALIQMSSAPAELAWETLHAEGSQSCDLGFTYGAYTEGSQGGTLVRGYYLHVWKRLGSGWLLAADVTNQ